MLSKLTFGEHATENARKFMRDGAHPSVHDMASPRGKEPRVTIADEAFNWADSGRANCILFRLVDSDHVDIASYALKFLNS